MAEEKLIHGYHDIKDGPQKSTAFYFLENVLHARIALNLGTGLHNYDEEVNIYIAYLLMSLMTSDAFIKTKPYISAYDDDVRRYLEIHPDMRSQYTVYRENADFGLISDSVFLGVEHAGSYHGRVLAGCDDGPRIALYYELAASALAHLTCANATLVHVLASIADNYDDVARLLRTVAADYFDFMEKLSDGEIFHLEREASAPAIKTAYEQRLDEFLKAYYDYTNTPSEQGRQQVLAIVAELKKLNAGFRFDESKLGKHLLT